MVRNTHPTLEKSEEITQENKEIKPSIPRQAPETKKETIRLEPHPIGVRNDGGTISFVGCAPRTNNPNVLLQIFSLFKFAPDLLRPGPKQASTTRIHRTGYWKQAQSRLHWAPEEIRTAAGQPLY